MRDVANAEDDVLSRASLLRADCDGHGRWRVKGWGKHSRTEDVAVYVLSCDAHMVTFCEQFPTTVIRLAGYTA
ncbi:MAG: hypothetical protein WD904_14345 [Dehalococcoidia bacterium]